MAQNCANMTRIGLYDIKTQKAINDVFAQRYALVVVHAIHRVAVTSFRCICMPAGCRRHLVGKRLVNVY